MRQKKKPIPKKAKAGCSIESPLPLMQRKRRIEQVEEVESIELDPKFAARLRRKLKEERWKRQSEAAERQRRR